MERQRRLVAFDALEKGQVEDVDRRVAGPQFERTVGRAALALTPITGGVGLRRDRDQSSREPCGSQSAISVLRPSRTAATAMLAETSDLPVPPFCATTAMTFIILAAHEEFWRGARQNPTPNPRMAGPNCPMRTWSGCPNCVEL